MEICTTQNDLKGHLSFVLSCYSQERLNISVATSYKF